LAEPRPSAPVLHALAGLAQCEVRVTAVQLAGDTGQACAQRARFHALHAADRGVDEPQHRPGVRFHRAADVEQQYEAAHALTGLLPEAADGLAARPDRGTE